ncbi:MAG TPA: aldo/keto reductase [Chthonomonadaceae bacterium]|nr:aldo/keto reductase [Chthonomonadaceae bacterium]
MSLPGSDPLERRRLGRSGLLVTALGLGGAGIGGGYGPVTDRDAIQTVQEAIAQGMNYVDTSPLYGESERRIGLALEGGLRERIVLSTKTGTHPQRRGDYSWDGTLWSLENSLRLLKTDYLDLVYVHDPEDIAPVFAPRGALEALEALQAQGVIGAIGLGQRRHDFHRQAIESGRFDVILTYNDYHPLRTTAADWLLPLAAQHEVGVVNGSPLAHGLLIDQDPDTLVRDRSLRPPERDLNAARRFYRWCRERNLSPIAVALQFSLRQPLIQCTLTGAKTPAELAQNLAAIRTPLPESLWDKLAALHLTAD